MGLNGIGGGGGGLLPVAEYAQELEDATIEDVARFINAVSGASNLQTTVVDDVGEFSTNPLNVLKHPNLTPSSVAGGLEQSSVSDKRAETFFTNSTINLDRRQQVFAANSPSYAGRILLERLPAAEATSLTEDNSYLSTTELYDAIDSYGNVFNSLSDFQSASNVTLSYRQSLYQDNTADLESALQNQTDYVTDKTFSSDTEVNYLFGGTITVESGTTLTLNNGTTNLSFIYADEIVNHGTIISDGTLATHAETQLTNDGTIESSGLPDGGTAQRHEANSGSPGIIKYPDSVTPVDGDAGDGGDGQSGSGGTGFVGGGGGGGTDNSRSDYGGDGGSTALQSTATNFRDFTRREILQTHMQTNNGFDVNYSAPRPAEGGEGGPYDDGGGGGWGGQSLYVVTTEIDNTGTLRAVGSDGADSRSSEGGGGGGGEGGFIFEVYSNDLSSGTPPTVTSTGGTGGSGNQNGTDGGPGDTFSIQL